MDFIDISSFTEAEAKETAKAANTTITAEPTAPEAERLAIPEPGTEPGAEPISLKPQTVAAPVVETKKEELKAAEQEPTPEERRKLAEKNAEMFVNLTDLVVSRLCSVLSGEDHERYKLHKIEKEEYKTAAAAYFETIKTQISPALVFFASTLTIFSGILIKAWGDRNRKIKERETAKKIEQERAAHLEQERTATREAAPQVRETEDQRAPAIDKEVRKTAKIYKEEVPEAIENRSNFEIFTADDKPGGVSSKWDDKIIGYYKKNADNERLKYEDVLKEGTKPSVLLERLIKAEIEKGKEWRIINKELRHYLKNLPSFDD